MEQFRQARWAIAVILFIAAAVSAYYLDLGFLGEVSKNMLYMASGVCLVLLCSAIIITVISGKAKLVGVLIYFAEKLLFLFLLVIISFGLASIHYNNEALQLGVFHGFCLLIVAFHTVYYFHNRKKQNLKAVSNSVRKSAAGSAEVKYLVKELLGTLILAMLCQGFLLFFQGNYLPLIVLLSTSLVSLTLWKLFQWRGWLLLINLGAVIYILNTTITAGFQFPISSLPDATVVTYLYTATIIPLIDLYTRKEANI